MSAEGDLGTDPMSEESLSRPAGAGNYHEVDPEPPLRTFQVSGTVTYRFCGTVEAVDEDEVWNAELDAFADLDLGEPVDFEITDIDGEA
jgi:hypothetical protein